MVFAVTMVASSVQVRRAHSRRNSCPADISQYSECRSLDLSTTYYGFRRRTMALSKSTNTQFRCYLSRLIRPPILIIAQDFD